MMDGDKLLRGAVSVLGILFLLFALPVALIDLVLFGVFLTADEDAPKGAGYWRQEISEELLLNLPEAEVLYEKDTHEFRDGVTAVSMKLCGSLLSEVERGVHWRKLPLHENIKTDWFADEEGNPLAAQVKNGYYLFIDRHRETGDRFDPSESPSSETLNYTVAIWDQDEGVLYYFAVDT